MQIARLISFFLLACYALAGQAQPNKFHRYRDRVPDKYIVVLNAEYKDRVASVAALLASKHSGKIIGIYDHVVGGFGIQLPEPLAAKLAENPMVESVHEVARMHPTGSGTQSGVSWGLDRIDERQLSEMDGTYVWGHSGDGVVVYILDSGVNEVGDLAGRIDAHVMCWTNASECEPSWLYQVYGYYDSPWDNHGTSVASIVGSTQYGVAKTVRFKDVQVWSGSNYTDTNNFLKALSWVVSDHIARHPNGSALSVVNFSHRYGGVYSVADAAVRDAVGAGITVVLGAGNDGADACNYSPARAGNPAMIEPNPNGYSAITVAASTSQDAVVTTANSGSPQWASNFGPCVDIFAPGLGVAALSNSGAGRTFSGTSAAAPHVAGLAAMRLERHGFLSPSGIEGSIRDWATPNVLSGVAVGTPNLLLYTLITRTRICCW